MLKITCTNAARLAAIEVPIAANTAVIVVPILSPNSTGRSSF